METRAERKERISKLRKEQILKAALNVFSRKGFGEATIPEIARQASVATGTIYNYYPSKRELLLAIVENFIITEPLLNLFQHAQKSDFPTFINSVLENRLNFIQEDENLRLLFLMSEIQRDPELSQLYVKQVIKPVMETMEKFYETRIKNGDFRPINPAVVTRALGGMVMGLVILSKLEGETSPLKRMPRHKLMMELTDLIFYGLQGRKN